MPSPRQSQHLGQAPGGFGLRQAVQVRREADGVATSRDDAPPFLQSNEDTVMCRRDLAVETRNTVDRRRDERLILEKQALPSRLLARSKEEVWFRVIAKQQGAAALRTSRRVE